MRDDRSNRSHDDLSHVDEEIDDFTEVPVRIQFIHKVFRSIWRKQ